MMEKVLLEVLSAFLVEASMEEADSIFSRDSVCEVDADALECHWLPVGAIGSQ